MIVDLKFPADDKKNIIHSMYCEIRTIFVEIHTNLQSVSHKSLVCDKAHKFVWFQHKNFKGDPNGAVINVASKGARFDIRVMHEIFPSCKTGKHWSEKSTL
jgi:hypothetical protein